MNIYEKLQSMRVDFLGENISKSGKNPFAGYKYFELNDIIPSINKLMMKYKITSHISYTSVEAILTLIDIEKPEDKMIFTSPMADAQLKGCHAVQNLGAAETYLRRYLWLNAFEIVENDVLDATHENDTKPKPELQQPIDAGWNTKDFPGICMECKIGISKEEKEYSLANYGQQLCRKCQSTKPKRIKIPCSPLKK